MVPKSISRPCFGIGSDCKGVAAQLRWDDWGIEALPPSNTLCESLLFHDVSDGGTDWLLTATFHVKPELSSLESSHAACVAYLSEQPDEGAPVLDTFDVSAMRPISFANLEAGRSIETLCVRIKCRDANLNVQPAVICNQSRVLLPKLQKVEVGEIIIGRKTTTDTYISRTTFGVVLVILILMRALCVKARSTRKFEPCDIPPTAVPVAAADDLEKLDMDLLCRIRNVMTTQKRPGDEDAEFPEEHNEKEWDAIFASVYNAKTR